MSHISGILQLVTGLEVKDTHIAKTTKKPNCKI